MQMAKEEGLAWGPGCYSHSSEISEGTTHWHGDFFLVVTPLKNTTITTTTKTTTTTSKFPQPSVLRKDVVERENNQ